MSHLSDVRNNDLEYQGIKRITRPQGTVHELNLDNALALAAKRSAPHEANAHLSLSTLAAGEARTLGAGEHGLPDVDTLTITTLGPGRKLKDRNVISFTYTLPAAANIRDL